MCPRDTNRGVASPRYPHGRRAGPAEYRTARGLRAQQLADRCAELGAPIKRSVLANLENGRRDFLTVTELLVLAAALGVAPTLLVFPLDDATADVEVLPSVTAPAWNAAPWFTGRRTYVPWVDERPPAMGRDDPARVDTWPVGEFEKLDRRAETIRREVFGNPDAREEVEGLARTLLRDRATTRDMDVIPPGPAGRACLPRRDRGRVQAVKGSVYRACGCRDANGRQLGKACAQLASSHGRWAFVVDLPAAADGKHRQVERHGFAASERPRTPATTSSAGSRQASVPTTARPGVRGEQTGRVRHQRVLGRRRAGDGRTPTTRSRTYSGRPWTSCSRRRPSHRVVDDDVGHLPLADAPGHLADRRQQPDAVVGITDDHDHADAGVAELGGLGHEAVLGGHERHRLDDGQARGPRAR